MTLDTGNDSPLLNGRRLFEPVGVNAPEQLLPEVHVVKVLADLVPVGVDESLGIHSSWAIVAGGVASGVVATGVAAAVGGPVVLGGSGRSEIQRKRVLNQNYETFLIISIVRQIRIIE